MAVFQIYKKLGETPLQSLGRLRAKEGLSQNHPLTYAGRLDPMAEGVMIALSDEDVHRKDEFTGLDKTYTLDVLWGIETDTYDLLGLPTARGPGTAREVSTEDFVGIFDQSYPPYSSKSVEGKQLWQWAREGRIGEVDVPSKQVTIHSIERCGDHSTSADELSRVVQHRLSLVEGDFRQEEIGFAWEQVLRRKGPTSYEDVFVISRFVVSCSSGTYMRSLAHEMGKKKECGACAFWIRRERVGKYGLEEFV
ncbi:MAG: hypothetical protein WDZ82_01845 [Candidatus Paceibacterota bacterium]